MVSPPSSGRPSLRRQSSWRTRRNLRGSTRVTELNQPHRTWIPATAQGRPSTPHRFSTSTLYAGTPLGSDDACAW
uniref:Uncharacterized protein n=1 Tax=Arundo donax TaxID=35708 RepID=A0A0A8Z056_ARUDO